MRLGGVILTGGHSQRMGRPKEWLPIGSETLLQRQCRTLKECVAPVVVVARDDRQHLPELPDVDVAADEVPDTGPLAGIVAGLQRLVERHGFAPDDAAFVTACDLPFVTAADVHWLRDRLGDADVVMPRAGGLLHPLASILRVASLPRARALLAAGTRTPRTLATGDAARVLEEQELREHDPELRFLRNLNTPMDLSRWRDDME